MSGGALPGRDDVVAMLASYGDRPATAVRERIDSLELAWLVHQVEQRYGVARRRVGVAAALPGAPSLADELAGAVDAACDEASLAGPARAGTALLLAVHDDPDLARAPEAVRGGHGPGVLGAALAVRC